MWVLPVNRQCLVDLHILTSLDATTAKNALVRIVSVKWVRIIDFIRLRLERNLLMLDGEKFGGVVNGAVAVVIVTDGAVEHVVAQDLVESLPLSSHCPRRCGENLHAGPDPGRTGSHQV